MSSTDTSSTIGRSSSTEPHTNSNKRMWRVRGESFSSLDELASSAIRQDTIFEILRKGTPYREDVLRRAVAEFFTHLGLPSLYYDTTSDEDIAKHISALTSARELARSSGKALDIQLRLEDEKTAFFAARSQIVTDRLSGETMRRELEPAFLSPANVLERYLDKHYLGGGEYGTATETNDGIGSSSALSSITRSASGRIPSSTLSLSEPVTVTDNTTSATSVKTVDPLLPSPSGTTSSSQGASKIRNAIWRLQVYRSKGVLEDGAHLRLYFLQAPEFVNPSPEPDETRIEELGDKSFLARTPKTLLALYQTVLTEASTRMGPSISIQKIHDFSEGEDGDVVPHIAHLSGHNFDSSTGQTNEFGERSMEGILLLIGHRVGTTHSLFSSMPNVYRYLGLYAVTKYVEIFSNGIVIFSFRLRALDPSIIPLAAPSLPLHAGVPSIASATLPTTESTAQQPQPSLSPPPPPHMQNMLHLGASGSTTIPASDENVHHIPRTVSMYTHGMNPSEVALRAKRIARLTGKNAPSIDDRIRDLYRDTSLLFVLPRTSLTPLLNQGLLSAQECSYAYTAWKFTYHFVPRMTEETTSLISLIRAVPALMSDKSHGLALISRLRKALQSTKFTESTILDTLFRYPDLVSWCYDDFCRFCKPRHYVGGLAFTPNPISAVIRKQNITSSSDLTHHPDTRTKGFGNPQPTGEGSTSLPSFSSTNAPSIPSTVAPSRASFDIDDPTSFIHSQQRVKAGLPPLGEDTGSMLALSHHSQASSSPSDNSTASSKGSSSKESLPGFPIQGGPNESFFNLQKIPPSASPTLTGETDNMSPIQKPLCMEDALATIRRMLRSATEEDIIVFTWFLIFNRAILKTNFFKNFKNALSFRLEPSFLTKEFPERPFGIFMVVGAEMRGFHVRFSEIARGGLRLIPSSSPQAFAVNVSGLFEECYGLALTQSMKNKDIPEGGSKGVILLSLSHQDKRAVAFRKYVDAILDLLLLPHNEIVDHYGKQEILFFGPDENTSMFMDWAAQHSKQRKYPYWKAITTGKSPHIGGIPHDEYGMTSRGVRAFELGIQRVLGLAKSGSTMNESASTSATGTLGITKSMSGGPDGDLGSNEILLSPHDTFILVIDGSGVLYDPDGLNMEELRRLAKLRKPTEYFNKKLLSSQGFFVSISDVDVRLPNGTIVPSGLTFRNNAHLLPFVSSQFFVPCGGRPGAVTVENVDEFLYGSDFLTDPSGGSNGSSSVSNVITKPLTINAAATTVTTATNITDKVYRTNPRFAYVVEGANLFFTNDARIALENRGILLFKDASVNKGGVTSSSLEVLASLVLTDEEFEEHMCCKTCPDTLDYMENESTKELLQHTSCPLPVRKSTTKNNSNVNGSTGNEETDERSATDGNTRPHFYTQYVKEVQTLIEQNARAEFSILWSEHLRTSLPITVLSDQLSTKITSLSTRCEESTSLWMNEPLRYYILREAIPSCLYEFIKGQLVPPSSTTNTSLNATPMMVRDEAMTVLLNRLPLSYQKALFASRLASQFIYSKGITNDEFAFFEYINELSTRFTAPVSSSVAAHRYTSPSTITSPPLAVPSSAAHGRTIPVSRLSSKGENIKHLNPNL